MSYKNCEVIIIDRCKYWLMPFEVYVEGQKYYSTHEQMSYTLKTIDGSNEIIEIMWEDGKIETASEIYIYDTEFELIPFVDSISGEITDDEFLSEGYITAKDNIIECRSIGMFRELQLALLCHYIIGVRDNVHDKNPVEELRKKVWIFRNVPAVRKVVNEYIKKIRDAKKCKAS